jgi:hypothetical protein
MLRMPHAKYYLHSRLRVPTIYSSRVYILKSEIYTQVRRCMDM